MQMWYKRVFYKEPTILVKTEIDPIELPINDGRTI